ncbi:MAG: alpha/beta hydrolase [Acidimicrobiia bacterium]|nr:alpha/beta hydrolase [Acidimicrobiia bacterium]
MTATYRSGANILLRQLEPDITHEAVDLVAEDGGVSRGLLYRPRGQHPKVGVHLMHPRTDQSRNYSIPPLVRAGYTVLGRAGRWVNNDIATVHERLLFDVAAGVRLLREQGCERVILLGNSGGGSLACFYQAQARADPLNRLSDTAAHDPIDLAAADLPPADAIVLLGAHLGEGECLGRWIDPSVTDEDDDRSRQSSLDMYDPVNGFRVPPQPSSYSAEFLTEYRAAQRARIGRLDAMARRMIRDRNGSRPDYLVIRRTMADPAFCDLSIEPDDRVISAYNSNPRPDLVNEAASVAPVLTPEAWLSTWSGQSSRAEALHNLPSITEPVLVVHYCGDVITHVSQARAMADAAGGEAEVVLVRNADHYGYHLEFDGRQGERTAEGTDAVVAWMTKRYPAG